MVKFIGRLIGKSQVVQVIYSIHIVEFILKWFFNLYFQCMQNGGFCFDLRVTIIFSKTNIWFANGSKRKVVSRKKDKYFVTCQPSYSKSLMGIIQFYFYKHSWVSIPAEVPHRSSHFFRSSRYRQFPPIGSDRSQDGGTFKQLKELS